MARSSPARCTTAPTHGFQNDPKIKGLNDLLCYHYPTAVNKMLCRKQSGRQRMNLTDLRSASAGWKELAAGLSNELSLWKDCNGPILYMD
jgi:hypothetical protein